MNNMFEMRERAKVALRAVMAHAEEGTIAALAEWLLHEGALFPPVKVGQTLYAAVGCKMEVEDDGIDEWKVHGVAYHEGKWYIIDRNGDGSRLGDWDCLLTRQDAERVMKEAENEKEID